MKKTLNISLSLRQFGYLALFFTMFGFYGRAIASPDFSPWMQTDTTDKDSAKIELPFPFKDNQEGIPGGQNGIYLSSPSNIKGEFVYDPVSDSYIYQQKIGDMDYRNPTHLTLEEYREYEIENSGRDFFREKSKEEDLDGGVGFRPKLYVENKTFDLLFGGNTIDVRPQGSAELSFGVNTTTRENPAIPENQRKTTNFDFDEKIQLNVVGSIGDKLKISTSYNTEATFDFENQTKIEYTGYEDEIIQKIELGNVALPLNGSLIQGSQTLFGIKTELKFGRMRITSVFSQEKGERKEVNVAGGSQISEYELSASDYEEYQHFFLGHYFRDRYNEALSDLPNVITGFRITKVEVWETQRGGNIQNARNVIAFTDLGESFRQNMTPNSPLVAANRDIADNFLSNNLWAILTQDQNGVLGTAEQNLIRSFTGAREVLENKVGLEQATDFETFEGVLMTASEYNVNYQLGYISLNRKMDQQDILGVAYEYIIGDRTYRVGEISNNAGENQEAIYVKLLKSTLINTDVPMWDLMMKNVYYLNSFGISEDEFRFEIWYLDNEQGIELPFIADGPIDGELLLQVMELDNLDPYKAQHEDGEFDYIEGITIRADKGRVYFPVVEPFGSHLREKLNNPDLGDKYAFDSLYSTTKALAELDANKNRFTIKGSYKSSSSSEIRLNAFNIPQGSVVVTAGGVKLTENVDYTVDYNLGTVKILNQGLMESNTPIKVSLESNSLFNIQTKTLLGSRVDYNFSENLKIGGTVLNLKERPLTNKVNIGDEAINNTIVGVDGSYSTEAPILTKIADALPLFDTKEKSRVNVSGEFAYLFPGNAKAITKEGVAYIDDFEGSQSQIDMKSVFNWRLASTPQHQPNNFPEFNDSGNDLVYGYNRAKLSWYVIDPLFFNPNDARKPGSITTEVQQNHYQREVIQQEIFPLKSFDQTLIGNIPVLDITYYPDERGQYNYDPFNGEPGVSAGVEKDGKLKSPESRWGGMMRDIQTTDFEESNIEFIQFWVMDPFIRDDYFEIFKEEPRNGGFLYFNLGEVSEDILKDDRKSYENGYPYEGNPQPVDSSIWGLVPVNKSIVNAFDNLPSARPYQDIGFDGLTSAQERDFYGKYLADMKLVLSPEAYANLESDPSSDNFKYFRDESDSRNENVIQRYANYNGVDGNSPVSSGTFVESSTTLPDIEDINRDNTTNSKELYYQYKIPINASVFNPANVGENYVTDVRETEVNGKPVAWYQFKIPIRTPDEVIGEIKDFKSIRFMRMYLKGFEQPVILRMAKLDLIRGEWRRFTGEIREDGEYVQGEPDNTKFELNAVNIEENSSREPIHYVLPPGIEREIDYGSSNLQQLNEQALSMYICGLNDGATRVAYRNLDLDIRQYKRLKMYAHVEDATVTPVTPLEKGDVSLIIRMGADFDNNYYEYELPLTPSEFNNHNRESVWPGGNNVDVELKKFTDIKINRDASGFSKTSVYGEKVGAATIRVRGAPNIATVKVMMIGIKNPKKTDDRPEDQGDSKCVVAWVNELRVADFDNSGGWAATAAITANLADLATLKLGGNMSTPGFGSLSEKLNERQQETKQAYDFSTNIELGKFTNNVLSIPMYYRFAESWDKPRYVPLNPDIQLEDVESSDRFSRAQKDSILKSAVKYQNNRSLNFTNVKLNRGKGKKESHIYDVQNFSFTYAYNLDKYRDVNLEYLDKENHRGKILWAYNARPKNYKPFDKSKWAKSPWLKLVKDFNFYLVPKQYQFSTSVDRDYNQKKLRQTNPYYNPRPYYQKKFDWDRDYRLGHDFTRNLKFSYNATNRGLIEETPGKVDKADTGYSNWRETVIESVKNFGTNLRYEQNYTVDYTIPINKIPITDWVNLSTSYNGGYAWDRAAIGSEQYGNTIRNTSALRYNSSLNFNNLYRKNDYLKRLAESERGRNKGKIRKPKRKLEDEKKLKKEPKETAEVSTTDKKDDKKKDKKKNDDDKYRKLHVADYFIKLITGIKEVSGSYTSSTGTVMPGYKPSTSMLGFDQSWDAPGVPFILGQKQDTNYVIQAQENGWLVDRQLGEPELRYTFQNNEGEQYSYRINIRPINSMRIELNGAYNYNIGTNMGYTWADTIFDSDGNNPQPYNQYLFDKAIQTGSFSVSTLTYKTAFEKDDRTSYNSKTFDNFNTFRRQASAKLATQRVLDDPNYDNYIDSGGFHNEYGATQQEVLISSFLAAYSGDSEVNTDKLDFKRIFPLPNWRITYDGIGKIKFMKKIFQSVTLNHAYRSTYNIGTFTTNNFVSDTNSEVQTTDIATGNYIPKYQISVVSITEMFSPFLDIDFNFNNGLLVGFEYKRDRNIGMSTVNNQLSETKGKEYIVSLGYTFRDIVISFSKNSKAIPKDIVTRLDISSRENYTILRNIGEVVNTQLGNGQNVLSIKFTADLAVSPKFNIRGFYDRIATTPFISNSFPTTTSNYGISLRFSLAQ